MSLTLRSAETSQFAPMPMLNYFRNRYLETAPETGENHSKLSQCRPDLSAPMASMAQRSARCSFRDILSPMSFSREIEPEISCLFAARRG
jgi:hypothetical protein